ncbi:MAG: hypothetical protein IH986_18500 [Planctomycetes bacterium]|nr:hypothetical protein [Planctomycetota bacterium]
MTDGGHYVGWLRDGLPHGTGAYKWPSGNEYIGAWIRGEKHGHGAFTFADGRRIVGQWRNNRIYDGVGDLKLEDGTPISVSYRKGEYAGLLNK